MSPLRVSLDCFGFGASLLFVRHQGCGQYIRQGWIGWQAAGRSFDYLMQETADCKIGLQATSNFVGVTEAILMSD